MSLEDTALDGCVEIAGNERGDRARRDALVDPSPCEIGFDVAQKGVLAKSIDVEESEAIESLPRRFKYRTTSPEPPSPSELLCTVSSAVRSITLESRIGYRLRKQSPFTE